MECTLRSQLSKCYALPAETLSRYSFVSLLTLLFPVVVVVV